MTVNLLILFSLLISLRSCIGLHDSTAHNIIHNEGMKYRPPAVDKQRYDDALVAKVIQMEDSIIIFSHDMIQKSKVITASTDALLEDELAIKSIEFQTDAIDLIKSTSAAYLKCYEALNEVIDADDSLSQERYVEFLSIMAGESSTYDLTQFSKLPAALVAIFYTTACTGTTTSMNCGAGMTQIIDTTNDGHFLCKQVLKTLVTEVSASFQYTIRFDPEVISSEELSTCLETATENLLYDQLAGCTHDVDNEERVLESSMLMVGHGTQDSHMDALEYNTICRYSIQGIVDLIVNLPCLQEVDGTNQTTFSFQNNTEEVQCGYVRSAGSIVAHQIVEPSETLLRLKTVEILRDAINGGTFNEYLPENCLLY